MLMAFAIAEYVVPKFGFAKTVPGGTMPKDTGEKQSRLGQIKKHAAEVPGPGHYDMLSRDQKRLAKVLMGTFSKTPRDTLYKGSKPPPVGHYNADYNSIKPRLPNGKVGQSPRVCAIVDTAERRSRMSPTLGFYKPNDPTYRVPSPSFSHGGKRASSAPPGKKYAMPGPGSYEVKYSQTEELPPYYTSNKEPKKTFIDRIQKEKGKVPAPGHVPIDSKGVNHRSPKLHAQKLLADRARPMEDINFSPI